MSSANAWNIFCSVFLDPFFLLFAAIFNFFPLVYWKRKKKEEKKKAGGKT